MVKNIKKVVVGELFTNCYILECDDHVLIIDPGDDYAVIKKEIGNNIIDAILITHSHFDHINALQDFLNVDNYLVINNNFNKSHLQVGPFTFDIIKTPGHTRDSICFYFKEEKFLFCGDLIFQGSIGRTDLDTGNSKDMQSSLNIIKKLPLNTIIYPGHGNSTNLSFELENNPFF